MKKNILGQLAIAMASAFAGGANLPRIAPRNGPTKSKSTKPAKAADAQRLAAAEAKRARRAKRNMENHSE